MFDKAQEVHKKSGNLKIISFDLKKKAQKLEHIATLETKIYKQYKIKLPIFKHISTE